MATGVMAGGVRWGAMRRLGGRLRHPEGGGALLIGPVAFLAILYVVPVILVMAVSLAGDRGLTFERYVEAFSSTAFLTIIWRTAEVSAIVTVLCLLLGYPYAYTLLKLPGRARALFLFVAIAPFFTSILIRSYAWIAILGPNGVINACLRWLGLIDQPLELVYNQLGVLIGMTQIQLPLMALTLYATMSRIDGTLTRAAEGLGAHPLTAFALVFLPLSRPGIVSGCALVFTSALGFYVTPAMLGGPGQYVVTQSIYQQVSAVADLNAAATQASVLLLIVLALLVLFRNALATPIDRRAAALSPFSRSGIGLIRRQQHLLRKLGAGTVIIETAVRSGRWTIFALTATVLIAPVLVVFPLAFSDLPYLAFPPHGFSLQWLAAYLGDRDWLASTAFSAWISFGGAILATTVGSIAAYALSRPGTPARGAYEMLFISPMILPQFVVALAMYVLIAKLGLVGQPITFILAYGVFGFPFVFLIMYAAFQRFDQTLIRAAAILGARPFGTWRRVVIPILAPAFASALCFAFLIAFDDLVVALFFSTAESYTLPMRMWDDIRLEISPRIAAVAVIVFTTAAFLFALTQFATRRRRSA